jgi:protein tyrosine/serine phosphatase
MPNEKTKEKNSKGVTKLPRWLRIAILAAIVGGGIWLWEKELKDQIIPKRWGVVEQGGIYRSGQLSARLVKQVLKNHGIAVIVALTAVTPGDKNQLAEEQAASELGIEVIRCPLKGNGTGDIACYAKAIAAIVDAKKAGKPVLVHCAAGSQRTGGIVACYRVLVEKRSPDFAYDELLHYDWHDKPDQILLTYINNNMKELARILVEMGVIDRIPDPLPKFKSKYEKSGSS